MTPQDVHEANLWNEFWAPLLCRQDGTVDMDLVKRELADYAYVIEQVAQVYDDITGGRLSKVGYPAKTVIAAVEEHIQDRIDWAINDFIEDNDLPQELKVPE